MKKPLIDHDKLLEMLSYDPETGIFKWNVSRNSYGGKVKIGTVAGTLDRYGYRVIVIFGRKYWATRLAWFYCYREWPPAGCEVDHINMVPLDNRLANLRLAPSKTFQRANQKVREDSGSGIKGVRLLKKRVGSKRWQARITAHGHVRYLGYFATKEEAAAAYAKAAQETFGEFARTE